MVVKQIATLMTLKLLSNYFEQKRDSNVSGTTFIEKTVKLILWQLAGLNRSRDSYS
jgi:hypothetical protein